MKEHRKCYNHSCEHIAKCRQQRALPMKWVYGLLAIVSIMGIILALRLAGVFEQRVAAPPPPSIPQATAPALPPVPAPAPKQPAGSAGPQLLSPCNNCTAACITRNWQFHWFSYNGATVYRFELSENADLSAPLVATTVESTSYSFQSALKCDTRYFWRARAVSPISSDWSQVWSFLATRELPPPKQ